jgi:hypothetical protein
MATIIASLTNGISDIADELAAQDKSEAQAQIDENNLQSAQIENQAAHAASDAANAPDYTDLYIAGGVLIAAVLIGWYLLKNIK